MWRVAIHEWTHTSTDLALALIASDAPIPKFAREWLVLVLSGQVKRKRGARPKEKTALEALASTYAAINIRREFYLQRAIAAATDERPDTPTREAIAVVAEKFGMAEDAVSRVVFPRPPRKARVSKK